MHFIDFLLMKCAHFIVYSVNVCNSLSVQVIKCVHLIVLLMKLHFIVCCMNEFVHLFLASDPATFY